MPYAPMSLCVVTGCPHLVPHGRCEQHRLEAQRENDKRRPNSTQRGYDHRWAKEARAYLNDHRECEGEACQLIPWPSRPNATEVDHRDGLGPNGPRGHDPNNFRALCKSCHSKKTARNDGGFGRAKRTDNDWA